MKKNISYILLMMLLAFAFLSGCGAAAEPENTEGISVVATIFPLYDFASQVAGDNAEISILISPGTEMHSYEPSPQDIIRIQNCDVFLYVGGESDDWVPGILDAIDTKEIRIVRLMDSVEAVEEEFAEGMEQGGTTAGDADFDEHIWTSPRNAAKIVTSIVEALSASDPGNQETYSVKATAYLEKLSNLDHELESVVAEANRKTIIVADRFAHRYLVDAYGLDYYAAFPGCTTETEPSAATVAFLIDKVREEKIPSIFYIEFSNQKMADTIAEATGASKLLLHSCHNVTLDEFENGVSYLSLMEQNVVVLKEALN